MATYVVTQVRKEWSADHSHQHIAGVCTLDGAYSTRGSVVTSIATGNVWYTQGGGAYETIRPLGYCPAANCIASPYITTDPDHTTANNLEMLPLC